MKEHNIEQMKHVLGAMESVQRENPKATVLYDFENGRINITFPLPPSYLNIKGTKYKVNG